MNREDAIVTIKQKILSFNIMRSKYNYIHKEWKKAVLLGQWEAVSILKKELNSVDIFYEKFHLELIYFNLRHKKDKDVIMGVGYC